ncbi:MAG: hypothetical protein AAF420_09305 [Pseudomonadota bacterium]
MACFSGRNAAFTTDEYDNSWIPDNPETALEDLINSVLDHGQPEYIVSVHWLKTAVAVREECAHLEAADVKFLVASVDRFINSKMKRRQVRRTAYQSINFVEKA